MMIITKAYNQALNYYRTGPSYANPMPTSSDVLVYLRQAGEHGYNTERVKQLCSLLGLQLADADGGTTKPRAGWSIKF